jgi:PAS domain S-box-containing protein
LLGYSREELLGLRVTDVARIEDADAEYDDFVAHRARDGQSRLVRKDGGEITIAYRASETTVAGMRFYVAIGWPVE